MSEAAKVAAWKARACWRLHHFACLACLKRGAVEWRRLRSPLRPASILQIANLRVAFLRVTGLSLPVPTRRVSFCDAGFAV